MPVNLNRPRLDAGSLLTAEDFDAELTRHFQAPRFRESNHPECGDDIARDDAAANDSRPVALESLDRLLDEREQQDGATWRDILTLLWPVGWRIAVVVGFVAACVWTLS